MPHRTLVSIALLAMLCNAGCSATKKPSAANGTDTTAIAGNPTETPQGTLNPQPTAQPAPPGAQGPATTAPPATPPPASRGVAGGPYYAPEPARRMPAPRRTAPSGLVAGRLVPRGTPIHMRVSEKVSSEYSRRGSHWSGVVTRAVIVGRRVVIPAGARAGGYVSESVPAQRGTHARLQLALSSVYFDGRSHAVRGYSQEIVVGSPRARNLGGIAAGTIGGALLGRAVGGSGRGALIGGLLGGGAATAVVAHSRGWQARIEPDRGFTIYTR